MTEPLKFPKKDPFIAPYIMGWLLGNGELSEKQLSSILTDQEVIDRISLNVQVKWKIGYDPNTDRITIPIRNEFGQLIGIKGRRNYSFYL